MSTKEREQLYAEFSILSSLKHPNIVGYFHREHLKNSQDLYIYMEYCGGGDLGTIIKTLKASGEYATEEFVWRIFAQIIAALYRCHYGIEPPTPGSDLSRQKDPRSGLKSKIPAMIVLHRDLKPENSESVTSMWVVRADLCSLSRRRSIRQARRLWIVEAHAVA
jgi:NIMA (never in mitosis gene a)-related kinase 2